jgi:hypothetical protein
MNLAHTHWQDWLALATEIIPKLPTRRDSLLVSVVKCLGIVDSVQKRIVPPRKASAVFKYFQSMDLVVSSGSISDYIPHLFLTTSVRKLFKEEVVPLDEHFSVLAAKHPTAGSIYIVQEVESYAARAKNTWYINYAHTKGFDFKEVLRDVWTLNPNGLQIEYEMHEQGATMTHYSPIPQYTDPILGAAVQEVLTFQEQHLKYVADGVPRTYLFYGKPGVGKSSFALHLAKGCRTLRIGACGLTNTSAKELDALIEALVPEFIIIDDIDRVSDLVIILPTLLRVFAEFKAKHPNVTVILTANDATKLDSAFLRPGRIDEIVDFEVPSADDRAAILRGYAEAFGIKGNLDLEPLVTATEGLTGAYLKEVALQLKYRPVSKVLALVERMTKQAV